MKIKLVFIYLFFNLYSYCFTGPFIINDSFAENNFDSNGNIQVCGHFKSNDTLPLIDIKLNKYRSRFVIINNSLIEGPGILINSSDWNCNLIIQNCKFVGTYFANEYCCRKNKLSMKFTHPKNLIFENNLMEQCGTLYIAGCAGTDLLPEKANIKIRFNKVKNCDGRVPNGIGGYLLTLPGVGNQAKNHAGFIGVGYCYNNNGNFEISWNEIINEPENSLAEDIINFYQSSGSNSYPISVHNNFIQGIYPYPANSKIEVSGVAINAVDGCKGLLSNTTDGKYIKVYDNQIVNVAGSGISINAGSNITITGNKITSTGKLKSQNDYFKSHELVCQLNEDRITSWGDRRGTIYCAAIYVNPFFYMYSGICEGNILELADGSACWMESKYFGNHTIKNNYIKWGSQPCNINLLCGQNTPLDEKFIATGGLYTLNPTKYPYNCQNNVCTDEVSFQDEDFEFYSWQKKVYDNNKLIGLISNTTSTPLFVRVPVRDIYNETFTAYEKIFVDNGTTLNIGTILQINEFSFTVCSKNNTIVNENFRSEENQDKIDKIENNINFENQNTLVVYPNPTSEKVFLKSSFEHPQNLKVSIYSNIGKIVFELNVLIQPESILELPLLNLTPGLYSININNNDHNSTQKIIIF